MICHQLPDQVDHSIAVVVRIQTQIEQGEDLVRVDPNVRAENPAGMGSAQARMSCMLVPRQQTRHGAGAVLRAVLALRSRHRGEP